MCAGIARRNLNMGQVTLSNGTTQFELPPPEVFAARFIHYVKKHAPDWEILEDSLGWATFTNKSWSFKIIQKTGSREHKLFPAMESCRAEWAVNILAGALGKPPALVMHEILSDPL